MNPVDIIQNDPTVPLGVFGELLAEWQVPVRIHRADAGAALPANPAAVIVLGGTMGVHDAARLTFLSPLKASLARVVAAGTPLLGICLGAQLLADVTGGVVSSNCCGEQGLVDIELTPAGLDDPLFAGVGQRFQAFQWHNDSFTIPPGALHLATSPGCSGQGFRVGNAWGLQFHPEVDRQVVAGWSRHSPARAELLAAFAAAEAEHLRLARQLLANFLRVVGLRDC
jgi:GMP synthase (glutamine-hydrolysing)